MSNHHPPQRYPRFFYTWLILLFILLVLFVLYTFTLQTALAVVGIIVVSIMGVDILASRKRFSRFITSLLLIFCLMFLFSAMAFIFLSLPHRGEFYVMGGNRSIRIGPAQSGTIISGSYSSAHDVGFFIVDEANYSRWEDGLSYDSYSHRFGTHESFHFVVPYGDTWYAVFQITFADFHTLEYSIHVGLPSSVQTLLFVIAGIGLAGISGMLILLKVRVAKAGKIPG